MSTHSSCSKTLCAFAHAVEELFRFCTRFAFAFVLSLCGIESDLLQGRALVHLVLFLVGE